MNAKLVRAIHPEVRVLDEAAGVVEYVASDETLDSYREIIRSDGWRFTNFRKNAPFVDSHNYGTIEKQVGIVVEFGVANKKLVETVKWAIDVPGNQLAQLGFAMTKAGYLKAVSVGFHPVRMASKWDNDPTDYVDQLSQLGLKDVPEDKKPRVVYKEQEQVELSSVIIGANPNALAKAYKDGVLSDSDLNYFAAEHDRKSARQALRPGRASLARGLGRLEFLRRIENALRKT